MRETENRIIELHKQGIPIPDIANSLGKIWTNRVVAGVIAKNDMIYQTEMFVVIPSIINYPFTIIKDY